MRLSCESLCVAGAALCHALECRAHIEVGDLKYEEPVLSKARCPPLPVLHKREERLGGRHQLAAIVVVHVDGIARRIQRCSNQLVRWAAWRDEGAVVV